MPSRAGCQLLALDQDDVGPALLREVVERRDADDASADHDDPNLRFHGDFPLDRYDGRARAESPSAALHAFAPVSCAPGRKLAAPRPAMSLPRHSEAVPLRPGGVKASSPMRPRC